MTDTLFNWIARRSGPAITVEHSTGKISGVQNITAAQTGRIIALTDDRQFILSTKPHEAATVDTVNDGISDLFFNYEPATEAYAEGTLHVNAAGDFDEADLPPSHRDVAESFQAALRLMEVVPPSVEALWRDFVDRV